MQVTIPAHSLVTNLTDVTPTQQHHTEATATCNTTTDPEPALGTENTRRASHVHRRANANALLRATFSVHPLLQQVVVHLMMNSVTHPLATALCDPTHAIDDGANGTPPSSSMATLQDSATGNFTPAIAACTVLIHEALCNGSLSMDEAVHHVQGLYASVPCGTLGSASAGALTPSTRRRLVDLLLVTVETKHSFSRLADSSSTAPLLDACEAMISHMDAALEDQDEHGQERAEFSGRLQYLRDREIESGLSTEVFRRTILYLLTRPPFEVRVLLHITAMIVRSCLEVLPQGASDKDGKHVTTPIELCDDKDLHESCRSRDAGPVPRTVEDAMRAVTRLVLPELELPSLVRSSTTSTTEGDVPRGHVQDEHLISVLDLLASSCAYVWVHVVVKFCAAASGRECAPLWRRIHRQHLEYSSDGQASMVAVASVANLLDDASTFPPLCGGGAAATGGYARVEYTSASLPGLRLHRNRELPSPRQQAASREAPRTGSRKAKQRQPRLNDFPVAHRKSSTVTDLDTQTCQSHRQTKSSSSSKSTSPQTVQPNGDVNPRVKDGTPPSCRYRRKVKDRSIRKSSAKAHTGTPAQQTPQQKPHMVTKKKKKRSDRQAAEHCERQHGREPTLHDHPIADNTATHVASTGKRSEVRTQRPRQPQPSPIVLPYLGAADAETRIANCLKYVEGQVDRLTCIIGLCSHSLMDPHHDPRTTTTTTGPILETEDLDGDSSAPDTRSHGRDDAASTAQSVAVPATPPHGDNVDGVNSECTVVDSARHPDLGNGAISNGHSLAASSTPEHTRVRATMNHGTCSQRDLINTGRCVENRSNSSTESGSRSDISVTNDTQNSSNSTSKSGSSSDMSITTDTQNSSSSNSEISVSSSDTVYVTNDTQTRSSSSNSWNSINNSTSSTSSTTSPSHDSLTSVTNTMPCVVPLKTVTDHCSDCGYDTTVPNALATNALGLQCSHRQYHDLLAISVAVALWKQRRLKHKRETVKKDIARRRHAGESSGRNQCINNRASTRMSEQVLARLGACSRSVDSILYSAKQCGSTRSDCLIAQSRIALDLLTAFVHAGLDDCATAETLVARLRARIRTERVGGRGLSLRLERLANLLELLLWSRARTSLDDTLSTD